MKPLALVAFLGCVSHAAASAVLDVASTAEDSFVIDVPHKEHRRLQSATTCPVLFADGFYCDSDTNLGYGFASPEACGVAGEAAGFPAIMWPTDSDQGCWGCLDGAQAFYGAHLTSWWQLYYLFDYCPTPAPTPAPTIPKATYAEALTGDCLGGFVDLDFSIRRRHRFACPLGAARLWA